MSASQQPVIAHPDNYFAGIAFVVFVVGKTAVQRFVPKDEYLHFVVGVVVGTTRVDTAIVQNTGV